MFLGPLHLHPGLLGRLPLQRVQPDRFVTQWRSQNQQYQTSDQFHPTYRPYLCHNCPVPVQQEVCGGRAGRFTVRILYFIFYRSTSNYFIHKLRSHIQILVIL